jgi:hypothetical protein
MDLKAKKTQAGAKAPVNSPAIPAYSGGNAANTGMGGNTKTTGVYSSSSASVPQNENPHPKEFGVGKKSKSLI